MTSRPAPQCLACVRWVSPLDNTSNPDGPQTCEAFPAGIPDEIWWNRADHRKPYEGDGGIRWEAKPGMRYPSI